MNPEFGHRPPGSGIGLLPYLRWWAELLDSRFTIPGTSVRFGLDPVLSLVPGLGDLASPAFAVALLVQGLQQRVPRVILLRMLLNALIDALIGVVPVAGTVADVFWRANTRNLALLERYAQSPGRLEPGDYAFVWVAAAVFGMTVLVPVVAGIWIALTIWNWPG